jgi:23S rRNA (uracil1939-C5)-methyltransferase
MASGDIATGRRIELRIERIASGGAGVAHVDGKAVFTDFVAPGDLAEVRIGEERPTFMRAELVRILEASPERVEAPCPLYGSCGGCALQHLAYESQLAAKAAVLTDAFKRIGGFTELPPVRAIPSPGYGYRNRMQFHRVQKPMKGGSPVGLKQRGSEETLSVADCPIADAGIREALRERRLLPPPQADRFNVYSREKLFLSQGGIERGKVRILDRELTMDVRWFFQSNAAALEALIPDLLAAAQDAAAESADAELRAADLYCGVGTFASFLIDFFPRLDLLERDRGALALARENVRGSGVRHFALSDDEWARLPREKGESGRYGFAVVDPPRVGLSAELRRRLAEMRPRVLAYVSCDPATLARDAKELTSAGYGLQRLSCYDFYPQTAHVEALALFRSRD